MPTIYVGIDNGTSGTLGVLGLPGGPQVFLTPIKVEQSYTKKKQDISRIDYPALIDLLGRIFIGQDDIKVILERPFVNPAMFKTSGSALRTLEATLIAIESFKVPIMYCDSKAWQHALLPGVVGRDKLKRMSRDIGIRLFPSCSPQIIQHKDADGLLIAEWARRNNL